MKKSRSSLNRKFHTAFAAMLGLGGIFAHGTSHAAELDWDVNGTATGTGGAGTWDTTSFFWRTGTTGSATGTPQLYDNTSPSTVNAYFGGTAGMVTLAANTTINVNTITFGVTGYTLNGASGASLALNGTSPNTPTQISSPNTGTATVNAVIASAAGGLQKGGSGTLVLGGANTYTGNTLIRGGILSVSSIGTTGSTSSNLGALASGTSNINFGVSSSVATLLYTGAGETTTRVINLSGGDAVIQNDGSGALNFTSNFTSAATGTRAFTLQGSNGGTFSGNIVNGSATSVSFTKAGTGTWTLSGANSYTGSTAISKGTLTVDSAGATTARLSGTTSVSVTGGGMLLLANSTATTSTDRINNAATVTFGTGGGTLASANGSNEGVAATKTGGTVTGTSTAGLGALTLNASATLDFDSASNGNLLAFASFTRTAGTLSITNWTNANFDGTNSGLATDDRLIFSTDQSGNLQYFDFGAGAGFGVSEVTLDTVSGVTFYEVGFTPVPEPATWVAPALAVAFLLWRKRSSLLGTAMTVKEC